MYQGMGIACPLCKLYIYSPTRNVARPSLPLRQKDASASGVIVKIQLCRFFMRFRPKQENKCHCKQTVTKMSLYFIPIDEVHSEHALDDVLMVYSHDVTTFLKLLHPVLLLKKWPIYSE